MRRPVLVAAIAVALLVLAGCTSDDGIAGQNTGEPYIFLSFYSNDRPFDRIVFDQVTGGVEPAGLRRGRRPGESRGQQEGQ